MKEGYHDLSSLFPVAVQNTGWVDRLIIPLIVNANGGKLATMVWKMNMEVEMEGQLLTSVDLCEAEVGGRSTVSSAFQKPNRIVIEITWFAEDMINGVR